MENLQSILTNLGYNLRDHGKYWTTTAIYRGGDNPQALLINKDTGSWRDFVARKSGKFTKLIQLTKNLPSEKEAEEMLKTNNFVAVKFKPKLKSPKYYPNELLSSLKQDHSYWNKRGIRTDILEKFQGGVATKGSMKNRYVFPIFDEEQRVLGFDARDLYDSSAEDRKKFNRAKWKKISNSSQWIYPLFAHVDNEYAILCESIGDGLFLFQSGVRNIFVLFGVELHSALLHYLVQNDFKRILVATNNDKNNAGNNAAFGIKKRLLRFFDENQIIVALPDKNDFGEMNFNELKEYSERYKL